MEKVKRYVQAAMSHAKYDIYPGDQSYYGEIPGFDGVYANTATLEECRVELKEMLMEWMMFRCSKHLPLPVIDDIELTAKDWEPFFTRLFTAMGDFILTSGNE